MSLVALARVSNNDAGVASSLLNTGQQVGGALGLAVLGTVAWSAVASSLRSAAEAAHGSAAHLSPEAMKAAQVATANHALAHGFSMGYIVSAGIMLLSLIVAVVAIRIKREELAGINPMAAPVD
jgi:hypothetical protein